ncbi:hypothetical protein K503DRAFT_833363 [Rhizopogon vinicolor AM-OR11-026]|uniref:FAD-binding FR-type domain-containing protein n=1 Tax=Rhizopogon vinicolor AM-OR11-026 TaxID=1314800 RepID=A0A1B7NAA8_9AGAM|nr:hypothetical protein K503DRAFT_833363 [Rhizopogon vinicolor AM-OR11-026]
MSSAPLPASQGWHPGEQAVQAIINLSERVAITAIVDRLPEQHRIFHTSRLHFLPVTTLDRQCRPWASILCSSDGMPNFISSPTDNSLMVKAHLWSGDPIIQNFSFIQLHDGELPLISGIGLEVSTRRRNEFAGHVSEVSFQDLDIDLTLVVTQALGLCPKYINIRSLRLSLGKEERLPDNAIAFIHAADTAFLSTSYVAAEEDASTYPSRLGVNHRGGRPGFVRVRPSDGKTLVLPNYAGNRMMNSLGNIHMTPVAGMVFPSFSTGSVLYVTGKAETLYGVAARSLMPNANVLSTIYVTGFSFVENAIPLRDTAAVERSPYSPPPCYLTEENPPSISFTDVTVRLIRTRVLNETLATLIFMTSQPVDIRPNQNCVLDLSEFLRERSHVLLDWEEDGSTINDDCVRTWTVSTLPTSDAPCIFSVTMRAINGGLVTPILHRLAGNADPQLTGESIDVIEMDICARLRGIGGDLPVPEPIAACDGGRRLLWIAGGIGLTPFLSLTHYVASLTARGYGVWDVILVLSTREPEVMLGLIQDTFVDLSPGDVGVRQSPADIVFFIHVFSPRKFQLPWSFPPFVSLIKHDGRLDDSGTFFGSVDAKSREPHICGPLPFVRNAMKSLQAAGVDPERVKRESFTY